MFGRNTIFEVRILKASRLIVTKIYKKTKKQRKRKDTCAN